MQQLEFSWKDCGDVSYASNVSKITLVPDPLNLPGNITLGFSGELDMDLQAPLKVLCFVSLLFSERELTFTFAIIYRPSICLSVVCLSSVVCNVRAPYSGGSNFRQDFYGVRYLGHPLTFTENFTEIVPEEPLRRGS